MNTRIGAREFSSSCDLIEVTSLHRPDTSWRHVDAQGHEHRWYTEGSPALSYNPSKAYTTPTLVDVFDGWGYWEDGERYRIHHYECMTCGERVEPGYTADTETQYIPGVRSFMIDGEHVDEATFRRELEAEQQKRSTVKS